MRLMHIFWDVPMNGRQPALMKVAKKAADVTLDDLKTGDMLCFINRKLTRLATLTKVNEADSFGVLGYYRSPHDRRINPRAIRYIPESFGSKGEIDMDRATRKALLTQLGLEEEL